MSTDMVFRSAPKSKSARSAKAAKASKPAKSPKPAKAAKSSKSSRPESPSLVDPRLQARRIEVARGQGRRRLRWVLAVAVVAGLAVGAFALAQSPALDVDRIEVSGAANASQAQIREASGIVKGEALVSLDADATERRLEALPWVEQATVTRSWPGTVEIAVVERTPVAVIGSGSSAVLVDGEGRALGSARGAELPLLTGDPVAVGERVSAPQRWVASTVADLPEALQVEVAEASATASGVRLTLDDGITVRWGDSRQASAKADAVLVLLEQADRTTIDTIDVSVPRAATVTRS